LQLLFSSTVGAFYKLHLLFITGKTDVILNWIIIWRIFAAGRKTGYKSEVEISLYVQKKPLVAGGLRT